VINLLDLLELSLLLDNGRFHLILLPDGVHVPFFSHFVLYTLFLRDSRLASLIELDSLFDLLLFVMLHLLCLVNSLSSVSDLLFLDLSLLQFLRMLLNIILLH